MQRIGLVLTAFMTAVLVSGCGESSKSSATTSSASVSQTTPEASTQTTPEAPTGPDAALIAKTNAACVRIATRFASVHGTSFAEIARAAPEISSYEKQVIGELRRLKPTAAIASTWSSIVKDLETLANQTGKLGSYTNAKAAQRTLTEISRARTRILNTSQKAHFVGCERIAS